MTYWLWMSAGGVALAATVIHGIWGRKIYLGNINAAEMEGITSRFQPFRGMRLAFNFWSVR